MESTAHTTELVSTATLFTYRVQIGRLASAIRRVTTPGFPTRRSSTGTSVAREPARPSLIAGHRGHWWHRLSVHSPALLEWSPLTYVTACCPIGDFVASLFAVVIVPPVFRTPPHRQYHLGTNLAGHTLVGIGSEEAVVTKPLVKNIRRANMPTKHGGIEWKIGPDAP